MFSFTAYSSTQKNGMRIVLQTLKNNQRWTHCLLAFFRLKKTTARLRITPRKNATTAQTMPIITQVRLVTAVPTAQKDGREVMLMFLT